MRALAVIAVAGVLSQTPPPGGGPWPPPGVYLSAVVDTLPKVVTRVEPKYPSRAMAARIEGVVRLACVINADGTVGVIRVTKSLDAVNGIDAAAVAAVKQWQFSPAIKNGQAVPVSIEVEVAFTIRGMPRSLSWPDGFAPPGPAFLTGAEWHNEVLESEGVRIEVSVPPGWTLIHATDGRTLARLSKKGTTTSFGIMQPRSVTYDLDRPMTPAELQRSAGEIERSRGGQMIGAQSIGVGQAQAAEHLWAWHAYKTQTAVPPNVDQKIAPLATELFESIRSWTFEATAGGHSVGLLCFTLVPRSGTDAEKASWVADQAAAFGEILRRLKISVVP